MPVQTEIAIIKKYANRRLYNTQTSVYITLDDLYQMVKNNEDFQVVDAKTGNDITRQVLTQIIFDEENSGKALMPIQFLRQLIQFYDDSLQSVVPQYLEMSMDMFSQKQEDMRKRSKDMFQAFNPMNAMTDLDEIQRQNLDLIQKSFNMLNPFSYSGSDINQTDKEKRIAELEKELAELKK